MRRACVLLLAAATALTAPVVAQPFAGANVAHVADSLATRLAAVQPAARWEAFRTLRAPSPLVHMAADTLGEDLLLAVQAFGVRAIELRLIERASWRAAAAPPAGVGTDADAGQSRLLERAILARTRPLYPQQPTRTALLWFAEAGQAAKHTLWVAPLDPAERIAPGLRPTPVTASGRGASAELTVTSRDGEVLVETLDPDWAGASAVDTRVCPDCPHLRQRSTWRVDADGAALLGARPVDDAGFAVARAFDARRGYRAWSDRDIVVAPGVDAWMKARVWAVLSALAQRTDDEARVTVFGRGPADSLALRVRRVTRPGVRWEIEASP